MILFLWLLLLLLMLQHLYLLSEALNHLDLGLDLRMSIWCGGVAFGRRGRSSRLASCHSQQIFGVLLRCCQQYV